MALPKSGVFKAYFNESTEVQSISDALTHGHIVEHEYHSHLAGGLFHKWTRYRWITAAADRIAVLAETSQDYIMLMADKSATPGNRPDITGEPQLGSSLVRAAFMVKKDAVKSVKHEDGAAVITFQAPGFVDSTSEASLEGISLGTLTGQLAQAGLSSKLVP